MKDFFIFINVPETLFKTGKLDERQIWLNWLRPPKLWLYCFTLVAHPYNSLVAINVTY